MDKSIKRYVRLAYSSLHENLFNFDNIDVLLGKGDCEQSSEQNNNGRFHHFRNKFGYFKERVVFFFK